MIRLEGAAGTLRIPAAFTDVSDLTVVAGPAGTIVTAEPAGRQTSIRVDVPASSPSPVTLSLAFRTGVVLSDSAGSPECHACSGTRSSIRSQ